MSTSLSTEQIDHYREQGYVVVPQALGPDEIKRYLSRATAIAHGDYPPEARRRLVKDIRFAKGDLPMPADPEHALWKMLNPDRFDPVMAECLHLPRVLDAVSCLIGEDLLAFLLMFIYKPPGVEDAYHPFHQDGAYFPFEPLDQVAGVWIPLDPADADNGSLCVVPGSHRDAIQGHRAIQGVNAGAFAAPAEDDAEAHEKSVTFDLDPGDCVIFHSKLLHRTGGNTTQRHRRVITLHLASARCTPKSGGMSEFGFNLVRGRTYEGCLQPAEHLSVPLGGQNR
ncbi:MAG: phytanoyl-CoA dioxygenase family protein [Deltaproteobacteria bacterium]|nr:phytanoyl-CoA dioxygenase family protein [Deltaproteobacteria bacterium]